MSSKTTTAERRPVPVRRGSKALITAGDRLLLVKERHADGTSFWTLPGGGVEPAESMEAALRRELAEELRCRATVEEQLATFWYSHTSVDKLSFCTVFECSLLTPATPNPVEGVFERRWLRPGELPPSTLLQVRHLVEGWSDRMR